MHCSKKALEGETNKLRGHYIQVNDERNSQKRTVDEEREIQVTRVKTIQEHSDAMQLVSNQL